MAILAPKPNGPVLENTFGKAVSTPTDKRGLVTPKFWGLVRPHRSPLVLGGMAEAVTPGAWLYPCFEHPAHLLRFKTQMVALVTPKGAKRMTHVTQGKTTPTQATSATHHHDAEQQATPLDLHAMYRQQASCGYTRSLLLGPHTVQIIAARLRGISAIGAVLTAATDDESLAIGEWMHAGLLDALRHLAADALTDLERANNCASVLEGGAA